MFKVYGNIAILKIEFFNFSGTERVKQNQNKIKTFQTLLTLYVNHFSSNFNQNQLIFLLILKLQPFLFTVPRWAGESTDVYSNNNISKSVKVNDTLKKWNKRVFNKFSNDVQIDRLCTCRSLVIIVYNLWRYGNIGILKIEFFNFSGTERFKY